MKAKLNAIKQEMYSGAILNIIGGGFLGMGFVETANGLGEGHFGKAAMYATTAAVGTYFIFTRLAKIDKVAASLDPLPPASLSENPLEKIVGQD